MPRVLLSSKVAMPRRSNHGYSENPYSDAYSVDSTNQKSSRIALPVIVEETLGANSNGSHIKNHDDLNLQIAKSTVKGITSNMNCVLQDAYDQRSGCFLSLSSPNSKRDMASLSSPSTSSSRYKDLVRMTWTGNVPMQIVNGEVGDKEDVIAFDIVTIAKINILLENNQTIKGIYSPPSSYVRHLKNATKPCYTPKMPVASIIYSSLYSKQFHSDD